MRPFSKRCEILAYLKFDGGRVHRSKQIQEGVIIDYDSFDQIVGIEISGKGLESMEFNAAPQIFRPSEEY